MQKSPVHHWIKKIPATNTTQAPTTSTITSQITSKPKYISRDLSFYSDDGSHCSSVECVLEQRRPDPEAVLLGLGFGPRRNSSTVSRIPSRFLQPSKLLTQIDIDKFLEQYGESKYPEEPSTPQSPARPRPKSY